MRLLIVEDEVDLADALRRALEEQGYACDLAYDGPSGLHSARSCDYDLVLLDLMLPGLDGRGLLEELRRHRPVPVLVLTARDATSDKVALLNLGADDYLTKPFQLDEVRMIVRRGLDRRMLQKENEGLRRELETYQPDDEIIGRSESLRRVLELVDQIASTDSPVLIFGETGTGKELIARRIHQRSDRSDKAFITVNSAALPENLLESELFGHAKGAFTGAHSHREGLFQAADGGTLFLDEIGEVGLTAQVRLLRSLESGEIRRLGEDRTRHVDVRVLAATHRDLKSAADGKSFREDLYYRLNVVSVTVPALRDRREDIPLLAEHFARLTASADRRPFNGFTDEVMQVMSRYDWPGNVRELENTVRRCVIVSGGRSIGTSDLPASMQDEVAPAVAGPKSLGDIERQHVIEVLKSTGGNKSKAAEILGISRPTLRAKLARYDVKPQDYA